MVAFLLMALPFALWGAVQVDEHFYLAAGRSVAEGKLPYVDFPLYQGPLVAAYFGLSQLVAPGLLSARLLNVALACVTLFVTMALARRLAGDGAALAAGAVLTFTPGWLWHGAIAHSTLLAGFLVVAAALALVQPAWGGWRFAAAGSLLGLAAGTRVNIAITLVLLALYAAATSRRRARDALVAAASGGAVLALLYLPLFALAPDALWWGVVGYHLTDGLVPGAGPFELLVNRVYGVRDAITQHVFLFAALAAGVALALGRLRAARQAPHAREIAFLGVLAAYVGGSMLVKPGFLLYYLFPALPLAAALAGVAVMALLRSSGSSQQRAPVAVLLAATFALNFAAAAPNVIDFPEPAQSHSVMTDVAALLDAHVGPGEEVFTFHAAFAIEAGVMLSENLEMASFSYLPGADADEAARSRVVGNAAVLDAFRQAVPAAVVLTGDDFTRTTQLFRLPEDQDAQVRAIRAALEERYDLAYRNGEGSMGVEVWLRAPVRG